MFCLRAAVPPRSRLSPERRPSCWHRGSCRTAACNAACRWARAGACSNDNQPIQIQADSGIEWQDAHLYIARGNAVATRGQAIHADTLIAHYREAKGGNTGGNTEIYRVEAEGHVVLKRDAQTVVGDRAVYDVDQAIAVVTGKGLKLTTPTDVVTARDSLDWYDQRQIAVARGNAVATRNGKTVKADILTAYMVKTAPGRQTRRAGARRVRRLAKPRSTGQDRLGRRSQRRRRDRARRNRRSAGSMRRAMSSSPARSIPGAAILASTMPTPASPP
jgi:lipopolysaccharide export system protein LptA